MSTFDQNHAELLTCDKKSIFPGPDGAKTLGCFLESFKCLKILNLRLNFILDEGGIAIFTALTKHNSIEMLILEGCELGTGTVDSLCQLIGINHHILEMDLSVNHLNVVSVYIKEM